MSKPLVIEYYSDILCVWAWIAQRRVDELCAAFDRKIEFRYFCVDVFGDVEGKMNAQWQTKGGYDGFSEHVIKSATSYEDAPVNQKIWSEVRPLTSANAHLVLKAIEIAYDKTKSIGFALSLRKVFFVDAVDVGDLSALFDLAALNGMDQKKIEIPIQNGSAMAALMSDYKKAALHNIKGSPSYVIDGGRQTLYGNVGYRVLHANIDELLKQPEDEASWC